LKKEQAATQAVAAAAGRDAQAAVDAATAARAEATDVGSALALVQGAAYDGPRKAALGLREELLQVRTDTPGHTVACIIHRVSWLRVGVLRGWM
jgi:hypothetical protein